MKCVWMLAEIFTGGANMERAEKYAVPRAQRQVIPQKLLKLHSIQCILRNLNVFVKKNHCYKFII